MENAKYKTVEEIAIETAKEFQPSYYSEPFVPHEWVLETAKRFAKQEEYSNVKGQVETLIQFFKESNKDKQNTQLLEAKILKFRDSILKQGDPVLLERYDSLFDIEVKRQGETKE